MNILVIIYFRQKPTSTEAVGCRFPRTKAYTTNNEFCCVAFRLLFATNWSPNRKPDLLYTKTWILLVNLATNVYITVHDYRGLLSNAHRTQKPTSTTSIAAKRLIKVHCKWHFRPLLRAVAVSQLAVVTNEWYSKQSPTSWTPEIISTNVMHSLLYSWVIPHTPLDNKFFHNGLICFSEIFTSLCNYIPAQAITTTMYHLQTSR